jgi:hypothetical protein
MMQLKEFSDLKLDITWNLIDIGFRGSENFKNELSAKEIINYSSDLLNQGVDNLRIAELAAEKDSNIDEIDNLIRSLAKSEKDVDRGEEQQKWTVAYVVKCLKTKYSNCVDGLMELGNIWLKIGLPSNTPHVFQGLNNDIPPADYYTCENYDRLYDAHLKWVQKELDVLNKR